MTEKTKNLSFNTEQKNKLYIVYDEVYKGEAY